MFGGNKSWAERKPPKKKECLACKQIFQPFCGGDKYCKPCRPAQKRKNHALGMRNWRSKNQDRSRRVKAAWDLRKYGITLEDYESIFKTQGGTCAICKTCPKGGRGILRKLVVDHCHRSKKVRSLLCADCNTAIGLMKEDLEILKSAMAYLRRHNGPGSRN